MESFSRWVVEVDSLTRKNGSDKIHQASWE